MIALEIVSASILVISVAVAADLWWATRHLDKKLERDLNRWKKIEW